MFADPFLRDIILDIAFFMSFEDANAAIEKSRGTVMQTAARIENEGI